MERLGMLGAGLLVGLGLDCAGAPRSLDRAHPALLEAPRSAGLLAAAVAVPTEPAAPVEASDELPPGTRYVSLTPAACAESLTARGIAHEALAPRLGISSPVRLRGALSGVSFRTLWPEPERARTAFEILDCRLVLALDDFGKLLRARGIVEAMYFSAYRPPPAGWAEAVGRRHEGGLAIDIGYFRKADGTALNVEWDFKPRAHERICAPGPTARDATPSGLELRSIACEAASARLFHLTLTPAYDHVHKDHFHLELAPEKTDFVAR